MYPFIETIMLKDGKLMNMKHHQKRFERTRRDMLGAENHPILEEYIRVPFDLPDGILKCRVLYGETVGEISIGPYARPEIRSLRLVNGDNMDYKYKALDRTALSELYMQKGDCDDILIVRNGLITDSFMANLVFREVQSWITPDSPLLSGCQRACLLEEGQIKEATITVNDLKRFEGFKLINALNSLEEAPELPMEAIRS